MVVGCERYLLAIHRGSFVWFLGAQKEHQKCKDNRKHSDEVEVPHSPLVVFIAADTTMDEQKKHENNWNYKDLGIIRRNEFRV